MDIIDVSKSYGEKKVLSSFSLHIEEKKTTVVSGPSGIGKTTLFRIILGLESPDSGTVVKEGRVSALFQEDRLIENLSVLNNLLLVSDDKKRISSLLSASGLGGEEKSRVSTLSGGMKRRVALIRALLSEYDTLLLDEPFSGLDEKARKKIAALIKKEVKGRTLVVISHDPEDFFLLDADCKAVI